MKAPQSGGFGIDRGLDPRVMNRYFSRTFLQSRDGWCGNNFAPLSACGTAGNPLLDARGGPKCRHRDEVLHRHQQEGSGNNSR